MQGIEKRLEALEARAYLATVDSERTWANVARLWNILERYAAQEPPPAHGASRAELIAHGLYEQALARCESEEERLKMARLALAWEPRRRELLDNRGEVRVCAV
jgi:hypothetical protein